jgi:hypothetical protein
MSTNAEHAARIRELADELERATGDAATLRICLAIWEVLRRAINREQSE